MSLPTAASDTGVSAPLPKLTLAVRNPAQASSRPISPALDQKSSSTRRTGTDDSWESF